MAARGMPLSAAAVDETFTSFWRSHRHEAMFDPVNRWKRILVQVLVGAQLLSAAPFASAFAGNPHADATPCDGMMDMGSGATDSHKCPCCPDGIDSVAACLLTCVAASAIITSLSVFLGSADSSGVSLPIDPVHSRTFDPPLKPPPIA